MPAYSEIEKEMGKKLFSRKDIDIIFMLLIRMKRMPFVCPEGTFIFLKV